MPRTLWVFIFHTLMGTQARRNIKYIIKIYKYLLPTTIIIMCITPSKRVSSVSFYFFIKKAIITKHYIYKISEMSITRRLLLQQLI